MQVIKTKIGIIYRTTSEKNLNEFLENQKKVEMEDGIYIFDLRSLGRGLKLGKVRNNLVDETSMKELDSSYEHSKWIKKQKVNKFNILMIK